MFALFAGIGSYLFICECFAIDSYCIGDILTGIPKDLHSAHSPNLQVNPKLNAHFCAFSLGLLPARVLRQGLLWIRCLPSTLLGDALWKTGPATFVLHTTVRLIHRYTMREQATVI